MPVNAFILVKTFLGSTLQLPWLMCLALLAMLGLAPSAGATTVTLTDTNNWTVPTGVTSVTVEMWGGGGGSGAKVFSGQAGRGAGGGGGGYTRGTIPVTPGNLIAYSVGAGGGGGTVTPSANGGPGGDTTFGGVTTAGGGGGGGSKVSSGVVPAGGTAGTGGTANGGAGEVGAITQANGAGGGAGGWTGSAGQNGGAGGGVTAGTGGVGGGTTPSKGGNGGSTTVNGTPGSTGGSPGGGASGGSAASTPTQPGSSGAPGLIILTYTAASASPIVENQTIAGITNTSATLGATVVTNSGSTIDDYGVVYSQTALNNNPQVGGANVNQVQAGTSIGSGTAFTTNVTGLTPGTQYSFKGYAHTTNGYGYSPVGTFYTLANEPTVQASGVTISSAQRSAFTINWTRGNGDNSIVLVKAGAPGTTDPTDGTTYTANTNFGSGSLIGTGIYCVYVGTANSVTLSGLTLGTTYSVRVYEVNGTGGPENYLVPSSATNSATAVANIYYSNGGNATAPGNWTNSIGASPTNFNGGDTFVVLSGQTITAADSWTNNNGATLIINSGATLDMFDASRKLLINGSFVNNGTLINSSDSSVPIVNFINTSVAGGGTSYSSTLTVGTNYNVSVVAIGGGGGGASAGNPSNSIPVRGGGGGGGASAYSTGLLLQANYAYQVTVGGNGARATAGTGFGNDGGAGGLSAFGGGFLTTIIANGGAAGLAGTTNATGANGAGGAAGFSGNAGNYSGGNAAGGGGGGAADDAGAGKPASGGTGGLVGSGVVAQGGAGGSIVANTTGTAGAAPGGGGAGADWTSGGNKAGAVGGVGWVSVQFNSVSTAPSTVTYNYQSRQNGDWNDFNTWSVDKGSGFVDAVNGETPNNGHSSVVVQNGHTVTVSASAVTVNLTVNNGGTLTVSGGGLTVNRLTSQTNAYNLTVNGTLNLAVANALVLGNNTTNLIAADAVLNHTGVGAFSSYGTGAQLAINGSYVQNVAGSGKIPVAIWGAASLCTINSTFTNNIDGSGNDVQLNYGQSFANFIWNAQGGTTNVVYRMTQSTITNWTVGNLTISNAAGTPARLELTGTSAFNTSVTNLAMTGGNFRAGGGGSALTVNGPMAISAGTFDTGGTITALDNVSITGTAQVTGNARFRFAKAGSQSWTVTTTNALAGPAWVVNSGTALTLGSASHCIADDLTVNGTLAVNGNSTLVVNGSSVPSTTNAGSITVAGGSTLGGNGAIGASMTLLAGAFATNQIGFGTNGGVNTALTVTNTLALSSNTFYVSTGTNVLAPGDYLLITNTSGGITGSFASSPVISGAGLTGGATGTVVATANSVMLHVATAPSQFQTTTLLGSSVNPSVTGQSVTFTAAVQTNSATASGATSSYVFSVDGTQVATNAVVGGSTSYTTSALTAGSHTIQAIYLGDGTYLSSTNTLVQTVNNPTPPVIASTVWSAGNLIISGTNTTGTGGGTYYVLASTNVVLPMASWSRISTNNYGVGGTFSVTNQILPEVPINFYRIEQ